MARIDEEVAENTLESLLGLFPLYGLYRLDL